MRRPPSIAAAFVVGGVIMLVVERCGPCRGVRRGQDADVARGRDRRLPDRRARSGRVALGRDDRRRPACRPRPAGRRRVLVLPGDADDGRRVRATRCGRPVICSALERLTEIAVGFLAAFLAALLVVRPFLRFVTRAGLRAVRLVPHRGGTRSLRGDRPPGGSSGQRAVVSGCAGVSSPASSSPCRSSSVSWRSSGCFAGPTGSPVGWASGFSGSTCRVSASWPRRCSC